MVLSRRHKIYDRLRAPLAGVKERERVQTVRITRRNPCKHARSHTEIRMRPEDAWRNYVRPLRWNRAGMVERHYTSAGTVLLICDVGSGFFFRLDGRRGVYIFNGDDLPLARFSGASA